MYPRAVALQTPSLQLCILHTTAKKIKQLPPLLRNVYKGVFRSQRGLDLTTQQPCYLHATLTQAAELTDPSMLTLRIHPINNSCTVSAMNHENALKLVQHRQITYKQPEYAITTYIAPPMARSGELLQTPTGKNRHKNYPRT